MVAYIDEYEHRFGVDLIRRALTEHAVPIAPSTCYAHRACDMVSQADWDDAQRQDGPELPDGPGPESKTEMRIQRVRSITAEQGGRWCTPALRGPTL